MKTPAPHRVIKELLALIVCILLGFVVIPSVITFFDDHSSYKDVLNSFFVNPQMGAWGFSVSPYGFYLLMKTIV